MPSGSNFMSEANKVVGRDARSCVRAPKPQRINDFVSAIHLPTWFPVGIFSSSESRGKFT